MTQDLDELLRGALRLPPDARAALAASLLDSLDQEIEEEAEAAWQAEIQRRVREMDAGNVVLVPWAEARRRIAGE